MPLSSGTRLGPYEVVALIGEGGMGQVYRATDTRLNRTVALKVLPAGLTDVPDRRERFEREAHAIGALNHPNICTLHDIGRARPQPESDHGEVDFLVMEHVEGETVADRLTRGGRHRGSSRRGPPAASRSPTRSIARIVRASFTAI